MTAYRQQELEFAPCMWCQRPHYACVCTAESLAELEAAEITAVEARYARPTFVCCRGDWSDMDEAGQRDMKDLCMATTGGCSANKPRSYDEWSDRMSREELESSTRRARGDEFV